MAGGRNEEENLNCRRYNQISGTFNQTDRLAASSFQLTVVKSRVFSTFFRKLNI